MAVSAHADTRYVYSPGDGFLNLRSGPNTRYKILREMYNGSSVKVLETSGKWVRVRHESGAQGWAYSTYLKKRVVSLHGTQYVNSPGDGYLNLRRGPSSKKTIVRRMYHGSVVSVYERSGGWVRVVHSSGDAGWAFGKYLSTRSPKARSTSSATRKTELAPWQKALAWYANAAVNLNNSGGSRGYTCKVRCRAGGSNAGYVSFSVRASSYGDAYDRGFEMAYDVCRSVGYSGPAIELFSSDSCQ